MEPGVNVGIGGCVPTLHIEALHGGFLVSGAFAIGSAKRQIVASREDLLALVEKWAAQNKLPAER